MSLRWPETLDPDENKDYVLDWSARLSESEDTISESTWELSDKATGDGLEITEESHSDTKTTVWFTGGEARNIYRVLNTVTTAGGRVLQQTMLLEVVDN